MKKLLTLLFSVALALSLTTASFAQDAGSADKKDDAATATKFFGPALVASYPKVQQMVRFRSDELAFAQQLLEEDAEVENVGQIRRPCRSGS